MKGLGQHSLEHGSSATLEVQAAPCDSFDIEDLSCIIWWLLLHHMVILNEETWPKVIL